METFFFAHMEGRLLFLFQKQKLRNGLKGLFNFGKDCHCHFRANGLWEIKAFNFAC